MSARSRVLHSVRGTTRKWAHFPTIQGMDITGGTALGALSTVAKTAPKVRKAYRLFTTFDHTWIELQAAGGTISLSANEVQQIETFLASREVRALLRLTVATLVSPDSEERRESLTIQSQAFSEMVKRAAVETKVTWVKHAAAVWDTVQDRIQGSLPLSRLGGDDFAAAETAGDFLVSPLTGSSGASYFKRLREVASDVQLVSQVDDLVSELTEVAASGLKRPMLGHLDIETSVNQSAIYVQRLVKLDAQGVELVADSNVFDGSSFHRTVLLGNPGAGKTTLVHHLSLGGTDRGKLSNPILILRCIDYAKEHAHKSIVAALADVLNQVYGIDGARETLEAALTLGAVDVVLDGLDEINNIPTREEFSDRVNRFAVRYPTTSILVTSREVGYTKAPLDGNLFAMGRLKDFTDAQIREYAERWFTEVKRPELIHPFISDVRSVRDLAVNPLLLSLLCSLYRANGTKRPSPSPSRGRSPTTPRAPASTRPTAARWRRSSPSARARSSRPGWARAAWSRRTSAALSQPPSITGTPAPATRSCTPTSSSSTGSRPSTMGRGAPSTQRPSSAPRSACLSCTTASSPTS